MDGNFTSPNQSAMPVPIDHAHLSRYTLGNRPLEVEVLQLFAGQVPETFSSLTVANCAKSWHVAAHTLKGSARAVGAWAVAHIAEEAERAGHAASHRTDILLRLEAALNEVRNYVSRLAVPA